MPRNAQNIVAVGPQHRAVVQRVAAVLEGRGRRRGGLGRVFEWAVDIALHAPGRARHDADAVEDVLRALAELRELGGVPNGGKGRLAGVRADRARCDRRAIDLARDVIGVIGARADHPDLDVDHLAIGVAGECDVVRPGAGVGGHGGDDRAAVEVDLDLLGVARKCPAIDMQRGHAGAPLDPAVPDAQTGATRIRSWRAGLQIARAVEGRQLTVAEHVGNADVLAQHVQIGRTQVLAHVVDEVGCRFETVGHGEVLG